MHRLLLILLIAGVTPINPLLAILAYNRGITWAMPVCVLWGLGSLAWFAVVATRKRKVGFEAQDSRD